MNDLTYFALRNRARAVSEWLDGLERTSAAPVLVTIGRTTYAGAEYRQTRDHDPGTRAYRDGERTYVLHAIYLLGRAAVKLPPRARSRLRRCRVRHALVRIEDLFPGTDTQ